ncbi:MAG: amino acid adenylation domain-containing protein [Rhodococcus sp. (in: high G+C Gram-positive bacteria)]|nr:amino acid adenylation domain-containing protein [Rhodococcus sp. (in: high G+C Gram-positive bacteria)]
MKISPRDIFRKRCVELLVDGLDPLDTPGTPRALDTGIGPIPQTPILAESVQARMPLQNFYQSMLFNTPASMTRADLEQIVSAVLQRHGLLRARASRSPDWVLEVPATVDVDMAAVLTQSASSSRPDATEVDSVTRSAAGDLDPHVGLMLRAHWFACADAEQRCLLLVAHHTVTDGVSWRIVASDLAHAWAQVSAGNAPDLDPVDTSFRSWASLLHAAAERGDFRGELDHWRGVLQTPDPTLGGRPLDPSIDTAATTQTIEVTLPADVAGRLLSTVPAAFYGGVNDVLLAGFVVALAQWRRTRMSGAAVGDGDPGVVLRVKSHGRESDLFETGSQTVDLSRTVGSFTSIHPVRLDSCDITWDQVLAAGPQLASVAKRVKEQLRVPSRGIGYGVLRYLDAWSDLPDVTPQIVFNYRGRSGSGSLSDWTAVAENSAVGSGVDPRASVDALEINAMGHDGPAGLEFTATMTWPAGIMPKSAVTELAALWMQALCAVAECTSLRGHTPSDFPLVDIGVAELTALESTIDCGFTDLWPLSPLQVGLYFQATFATEGDVYVAQDTFDFDSRLDIEALSKAYSLVLKHNPAMRLGFTSDGRDGPVSFVGVITAGAVEVFDLSELTEVERELRTSEIVEADRRGSFDLSRPPLIRLTVIRGAGGKDRLLLTRHLLLWDGWSRELVLRRLFDTYGKVRSRSEVGIPGARGSQFSDYLAWLAEQDKELAASAWTDVFADSAGPTIMFPEAIGTDPVIATRMSCELAPETTDALSQRARAAGVTLNSIVGTALAMVLGHAVGSDDVTFGMTVAGRPTELEDIESVIGVFLNTIPARVKLDPCETVGQTVARMHEQRIDMMPHEHLGLGDIQRAVGRGQLFDSLYVLQNFVDDETFTDLESEHGINAAAGVDSTHYPLTWVVYPGRRLWIKLEYRTDIVDERFAAALLGRLENLLIGLADSLSPRLGELAILTATESDALVADWDRVVHPTGSQTIADLLADRARERPSDTALVFGEIVVGYRELDERINRLARLLLAGGAAPERVVALALPRSVDTVVALFAVLRTGAAYLPLDLEYPDERLAVMIEDAEPVLVVSHSAVSARFADTGAAVMDVDTQQVDQWSPAALTSTELGAFAPENIARLDYPAYVIYTSGSTGRPKGVVTGYRGLTNMQLNHRAEIFEPTIAAAGGRTLRIAHTVSFSFDMSWEELLWLVEGHQVHICDEELRRDARALVGYCRRNKIDVVNVTPTYAQVLLEEGLLRGHTPGLVLLGGEAVPDQLWSRLRDTPGTLGYNLYGPTEYTINTLGAGTADSETPTVGHPIWNTRAYILDGWMRPTGTDVVGELYIAGAGLARGYLNRPGLSAERFVADPWTPGGRMYRTGDLVRRRVDGNLDFLGRTDDQVKIRGYRIELGEIEAVLSGLDGVRRAAVVVRTAGALKKLAAYVVPVDDHDDLPQRLRTALAAVLPDYMVPTLFGVVDELPRTVNGKLDVGALPAPLPVSSGNGRAPDTDAERALVEIFAGVLGLDPETGLGVDDDFFTLGGDSISSIALSGRARKAGMNIGPRDIFRKRTVAALALGLDSADAAVPRHVADVGVGVVAHTPILAAFEQMPMTNFYQSMVVRTPAGMKRGELELVLESVLRQHDLLRAGIDRSDPWVLEVPEAGQIDVANLLIETGVDVRPTSAVMEEATREAVSALEPYRGNMLRAHWFRNDSDDGCLLLVIHHLAMDGVSWRILTADLAQAWADVRSGRTPALDDVGTSFRTWAALVRSAADNGQFRDQYNYWRDVLATPDPDLGRRPLDSTVDTAGTTDTVTVRLPAQVAGPLLSTVPAAIYGGVNDVLLAGFALALVEWRRSRGRASDAGSALLVSLEGHGRESELFEDDRKQVDLSRTIGWFTSIYPVQLDPGTLTWDQICASGSDLARAVKTIKEQLQVPSRGIGYGVLHHLDAQSPLDETEPQILFNYLGRFGAGTDSDWNPVAEFEAMGEGVDPSAEVRALSVNAMTHDSTAGTEFSAVLTWPTGIMSRPEIIELGELWTTALQTIAHCADLAGHTPSDFPLVPMTMDDIDLLEAEVPGGVHDVLPLMPLQQGMYFHSVQADDADPYVIQQVLELRGELDPEVLRQAVAAMVQRHPVLRASFRELADGRVAQVIAGQVSIGWNVADLSGSDEAARRKRFEAVARDEFRTVFDLTAPPLLRYTLVTMDRTQHRLVQTMHHLLADGWSYPLMFNDIGAAYRSLLRTGRAVLATPTVTFTDHVATLAARDREESMATWSQVLDSVTEGTKLIDAPRGSAVSEHSDVQFELSPETTASLLERTRAGGLTLSTVVHGMWGLLLGRILGTERVVFGSTVSGRGGELAGLESMVGPLINTVPVPMTWSATENVGAVLARLQDQQTAVLDHQHLGLVELAKIAGVDDFFDTIVVVENFAVAAAESADGEGVPDGSMLELDWIDGTDAAHYPVALVVHPGERLRLKLTYDTGLVDPAFARRVVDHAASMLAQFAADSDLQVGRLRRGTNVAADQLGVTAALPASETTLTDAFRRVAQQHSSSVAVRYQNTDLTYAELDGLSDRLARTLAGRGVGCGSRVAVILPRSTELVVALLAVLKAGGTYVPVDPSSPPSRIAYILDDSRPACVLVTHDTILAVPAEGMEVLLVDDQSVWDRGDAPLPMVPNAPDSGAYVIYTSGSTGKPKGVTVSHRSVMALFAGTETAFEFGSADVWTMFHSYAFDFSVWELWGPLRSGGRLVVVDQEVTRDPERLRTLLSSEGITVLNQTPAAFYSLIDADREATTPLSLRYIIFGGEALDLRRLAPWYDRHADGAPQLVNMYGITETCVHVTFRFLRSEDATAGASMIGVPIPGLSVFVLDQYLEPVAPGVVGEMYVSGAQLAQGYLGRAGLSASRFVADPFGGSGGRLYRSGDLARWSEDGELEYLGRGDQQIKVRGYRIEPGEIEAALLERSEIAAAAVVVRRDQQGRARLSGYLVARRGDAVDISAVQGHLAAVLPEYMIPSKLVVLEALPLTVNGKLDQSALPEVETSDAANVAAVQPVRETTTVDEPATASDAVAAALSGLFDEILGVQATGPGDDFFTLGGDSIIALQLVSRAKRLGLRLSPRDVFTERTPEALAAVCVPAPETVAAAVSSIVDPDAIGKVMLMPIVHRLAELGGSISRFNQSELLVTPAGTTAAQVSAIIAALVARHDGLRMRLSRPAPMLWALETVAEQPGSDQIFTVVEVSGQDRATLEEVLGTESDKAADRLDPDNGVMIQAVWFDRGVGQRGRLLLVVHHLAVDGVSWRILLEDLRSGAAALKAGRAPMLESVQTSVRAYSRILNEKSAEDTRLAEFTHWTEVVAPGGELVAGAAPFGWTVGATREHRMELTVDETTPLLTTVPAMVSADVTETLVCALRTAISTWRAGQGAPDGDVVIDLERHGREHFSRDIDLTRTVGWFTAIAPVRLPVGVDDPLDALTEVRERVRAAPDGGLGFGLLRYCNARTAGPLARMAQPQVLFNYLGRFEADGGGDWQSAPESAALKVGPSPDMGTPYVLEINAYCDETPQGPQLKVVLTYTDGEIDEHQTADLTDAFAAALRELARCAAHGSTGLSPADVDLLTLRRTEIEQITEATTATVQEIWPLSPLQEGLFFQAEMAQDADVYIAQNAFDLDHRLDPQILGQAYSAVMQANSAMRLGFSRAGGDTAVAFVGAEPDCPVTEIDLADLPAGEHAARVTQIMDTDRRKAFDLAEPPLARMTVIHGPGGCDRLLFTYHLLLWDGWSRELVLNQLFDTYAAMSADPDALAPAGPAASFTDYLSWLAEQDRGASVQAWHNVLADVAEPTILFPAAAGTEPVLAKRIAVEISEDVTKRLGDCARAVGVTLNALLGTALGVVLGHASGTDDVVFGTTVAGRPMELDGIDAVIGVFLNTVPARVTLQPDLSVGEAMRRFQDQRIETMAHEYLGLSEIQQAVGRQQLFDNLFVLQNFLGDDTFSEFETRHGIVGVQSVDATHFPMTWVVMPGKRLWVKLEFRPDVVTAEQAEALLSRFETLLITFADGADRRIASLPMLTAAEVSAQQAIREENVHHLGDATIAEMMAEQARRTPQSRALTFDGETITYRDFDQAVNRQARMLIERGARPEVIIGLALPRSIDMVVALFAVLRTGAAYLPLELDYPDERLGAMIDDAAPAILLTRAELADRFSDHGGVTVCLDTVALDDYDGAPLRDEELGEFAPGSPGRTEHPAYVIYTSGSTGRPKGVVTPYRGLTNMQFNHRAQIFEPTVEAAGGRGLRIAHTVSFSFDMSWEELLWLVEGHHVHICDEELRRDARLLVRYCNENQIDVLNVTPTYAQHLIEEGLLDSHRPTLVLLGGEPVPESLWTTLRETDNVNGYNLYGPTEYTINTLGAGTDESVTSTVGKPIRNTDGQVLDAWLRPVPTGLAGELYISGVGLARGYLHRPALTAERFVADPAVRGGRMYRTGDLTRVRRDGNIDFLGRTDDQVKIRGHRVELGEVEAAVTGSRGVRRSAVIAAPDTPGGSRLVAYLIAESGMATEDHLVVQVRRELREKLPNYMVPTAFAVVAGLPLTVNGKLDTAALPEPRSVSASSRAAATATERTLCVIFGEALDITPPGEFGVEDDFFDRGGHSLLAGRLTGRIRERLAVDISLRQLFDMPTPERLAVLVDAGTVTRRAPLVKQPRTSNLPLSHAQERLWLLHELTPGSAAYNYPLLLKVFGLVAPDVLRQALADVTGRHEVLRTLIGGTPGEPEQRILADAVPEVTVHEIDSSRTDAVIAAAAELPFDLGTEIPLRVTVVHETDTGYTNVLLLLHHIAVDEWSDRPLLADLDTAYQARRKGQTPDFVPLPVQYADYTLWQRELLGATTDPNSRISGQREFWVTNLRGAPAELALPSDAPARSSQVARGGQCSAVIETGLVDSLRLLAQDNSASMFMALHAGLAMLLYRHGAGTDIALGSPTSGRDDTALQDAVGFFVNTIVLRTDLSGEPGFAELLGRVRETALAALEHADIPFQQVVEAANPVRVPGRNPLFQVMLSYQRRDVGGGDFLGLPVSPAPPVPADPKLDLNFTFADAGEGKSMEVSVEFDTARFAPDTAQSLLTRLVELLRNAVSAPEVAIGRLAMLSGSDMHDVRRWQIGPVAPDSGRSWITRFAQWASRTPDAVACRFGDTTVTYAELDAASDAVAAGLIDRGAAPETIVGLALPRSVELLTAVLGVAKSGAAYLPLDPGFPASRLQFMVDDARPQIVLVDAGTRALLSGGTGGLVDFADVSATPTKFVVREPNPASAAYVIYTSGSTGRPKGVVVGHSELCNFLSAAEDALPLGNSDRLLAVTTLSFDIAVLELMTPLAAGACVVLAAGEQVRDPRLLAEVLRSEDITAMQATPSLWSVLLESAEPDLGRVAAVVGGETLPIHLARELSTTARSLTNMYGPTEATVWATSAVVDLGWCERPTIGRPMAGNTAYVLDAALAPVPPGVVGELYLGAAQVTRGYLNRVGLTAGRFVADPFGAAGSRMYRTGDLVRWSSRGDLEHLGRSDHQVKIRGFRIELGEIETALESHPSVARASAIVRDDRIVAYVVGVVAETGGSCSPEVLRPFISDRLPSYMVPSVIVLLDRLPQTPNGKVDRKALPVPVATSASNADTRPRSELEDRLCAVFARTLGVESVDPHDDFFVLGGHSLLLVRLVTGLQRELGVRVAVQELITRPTVAALMDRLDDGSAVVSGASALDPVLILNPGGNLGGEERPALFAIHPASGLSWQFAGLKRWLPQDVPLYALQAPGLSADTTTPASFAQTVAEYADTVAQLAPTGPIQLLGWSFGGAVAHGVAVELISRGRDIALLAMLDSHLPTGEVATGRWDSAEAIAVLLTEMGYQVPEHATESIGVADAVALVREEGGSIAMLDDPQIARVVQNYLASDHMMDGAQLGVVDTDVLFVDATTPQAGFSGAASRRWRDHVSGRLDIVEIACTHSAMLDVQTLYELGPIIAGRLV